MEENSDFSPAWINRPKLSEICHQRSSVLDYCTATNCRLESIKQNQRQCASNCTGGWVLAVFYILPTKQHAFLQSFCQLEQLRSHNSFSKMKQKPRGKETEHRNYSFKSGVEGRHKTDLRGCFEIIPQVQTDSYT